MKTITLVLFLLHALFVHGQVPEMSVRDSTILRAIDILFDSIRVDSHGSDTFVINAIIANLQVTPKSYAGKRRQSDSLEWPHSEYYWSYELSLRPFPYYGATNFQIPSCKFRYRSRDIYLYFGSEYFVKFSERDLKKLANKVPHVAPAMKVKGVLFCRVRENKIISAYFMR